MKEGLLIAFAGMGMTLGALVVVMLVMEGLTRLFPVRQGKAASAEKKAEAKRDSGAAAAAAVALFLAGEGKNRRARVPQSVASRVKATPWRISGREQLMASREMRRGPRREARGTTRDRS